MVRLYYLAVIQKGLDKNTVLMDSSDLSDFNYFRRSGVKEFMRFSCCLLAGRLEPGTKVSVREQTYVCHVFVKSDNLAAAAVTDDEYPHTTAHKCLQDLIDNFVRQQRPTIAITKKNNQQQENITDVKSFMERYREPPNIDRLTAIKEELDDAKIILHQTIQAVLRRGENLNELIIKSDDLSSQAKTFYKTARRTNACCTAF